MKLNSAIQISWLGNVINSLLIKALLLELFEEKRMGDYVSLIIEYSQIDHTCALIRTYLQSCLVVI